MLLGFSSGCISYGISIFGTAMTQRMRQERNAILVIASEVRARQSFRGDCFVLRPRNDVVYGNVTKTFPCVESGAVGSLSNLAC